MVSVSVITPSVRPDGLKLIKKALDRQTFKDYEWLVNHKRYKGGYWGLNRAYNELVRRAKGVLIVSWQDYTFAKPDALQKFYSHYQNNKKVVVGGVGNKYASDDWIVKTWQDPRERDDIGSFYEVYPNDIEFNFCAIPKKGLYEIGGWDEGMDFLGFGMDGISIVHRLDMVGYKFYLDQTNKSFSLEHGRRKDWDEHNLLNGGYMKRKQELIDNNTYPVLEYLQNDSSRKERVRQS